MEAYLNKSMQSAAALAGTTREYFDSAASSWQTIYDRTDVYALVHQERRALVLSLFDQAGIPPGSRVLEVGCGAGLNAVEIAKRGYSVVAVDFAGQMLDLTRENVRRAGVIGAVHTGRCDACVLPFPDASFDAVMAVGVLPWVQSRTAPLKEMARVLKPEGRLIVNMDNRWRLTHYADPASWIRPSLTKAAMRLRLCKPNVAPRTFACTPAEFDAELERAGMEKLWGGTIGFGPFWLVDKALPNFVGAAIHRALQGLANRRVPILRSAGSQYVVVSRKKDAGHE